MQCKQSSHLWLGRFCIRLMQLRRDMTLPRAVTRAVAAHAHSSHLPPEAAAAMDAVAARWVPPPASPQTIGRMSSQRDADERG